MLLLSGEAAVEVEVLGPTEADEAEARRGRFTQNQIQDGRVLDTLTYLLSTRAGVTGTGGSLHTRAWSHPHVLGEGSPLQSLQIQNEYLTNLKNKIKNTYTVCFTMTIRKYSQI